MKLSNLLSAIGSTEESSFREICAGLGGNCPDDKDGWRDLFGLIREAEREGYIEVSRTGGSIDSAILIESGAAVVRNSR